MRFVNGLKVLMVVVLMLFLCSPCSAARERVVLADTPTLLTALVSIAEEKGFFTAAGLDVVTDKYATGDQTTQALFSGKADVAVVAETAFVFDSFSRQDFSVLASIGSWDNEVKIIARKDRGIKTPADLRGKRIGTQKKISVHFFLDFFLLKHGMTEKDVRVSFMKGGELPKALAAGDIDAFSHREPFLGQAAKLLGDNAVILSAPGIYNKSFMLIASNKFINERPQSAAKLLKALLMAEEFAKKDRKGAVEIVSARLKLPPVEIQAAWEDINLRVSLEQHLLLTFEDVGRWAIRKRLVEANKLPNFLNYIETGTLKGVKPVAVTIIK